MTDKDETLPVWMKQAIEAANEVALRRADPVLPEAGYPREMDPERARQILDLWLTMSSAQLDNVCLSAPARLAVDELERAMSDVALLTVERRVVRHAVHELIEAIGDDERASRSFLPQIRKVLAAIGDRK